jgi:ATP-binding cassette subfamily B protein
MQEGENDVRANSAASGLRARPFRSALHLLWGAAHRELIGVLALQVLATVGLTAQLLLAKQLLGLLFGSGTGTSAPSVSPLEGAAVVALVLFAFATLANGFASALLTERSTFVGELATQEVMSRILDVACAVETAEFEQPEFCDQLERVRSYATIQPWRVAMGATGLLQALIAMAGIGVVLATLGPWLLPIAAIGWIPIILLSRRNARATWRLAKEGAAEERERRHLESVLMDKASALEVRAFGLRAILQPHHRRLVERRLRRFRDRARDRAIGAIASAAITAVMVAAGIALLAWLVHEGRLGLAGAGVAAVAIQQLGDRLRAVRTAVINLREAMPFLVDLDAFLARAPLALDGRAIPDLSSPAPFRRLQLEGVSFHYPGVAAAALRDVSLTIAAGETVALVGRNGSGKSTLAKLLGGLYRPTQGRILRDGEDLAAEPLASVRADVSTLFQDFVRYELPARTNIGLGRGDRVDDAEAVRAAARHADIDARLSELPAGYDTVLSRSFQGGAELSIGEWQRVALARAFLRDAPLIILDEPTSAIDPEAESRVLEAIRRHARGRTLIFISHRLSSVRHADRIVVLDAGCVVEEGTHDTLVARGGHYAELFAIQASAYLDGRSRTRLGDAA